jgi:hypothetical protein
MLPRLTLNSWVQVILLPEHLQVCTTMPGLVLPMTTLQSQEWGMGEKCWGDVHRGLPEGDKGERG